MVPKVKLLVHQKYNPVLQVRCKNYVVESTYCDISLWERRCFIFHFWGKMLLYIAVLMNVLCACWHFLWILCSFKLKFCFFSKEGMCLKCNRDIMVPKVKLLVHQQYNPVLQVRLKYYFVENIYYCCNLSVDVALNVLFTTNEMCAKNNTHIYVARTSNNGMIMACDLYCCLLSVWSCAVHTYRSRFPIATIWCLVLTKGKCYTDICGSVLLFRCTYYLCLDIFLEFYVPSCCNTIT